VLTAAERRYREAARLATVGAVTAARAWDRVGLDALDAWQPARLAAAVTALQFRAAQGADSYVDAAVKEQGLDDSRTGSVVPVLLAGIAGDGRSLVTLFDQPRIAAKMAIGQGRAARDAWDEAKFSLQLMAMTAVQDAGRGADSVAMVARPAVTGYVRMLNTPSCARCAILAGKFFRWNTGFSRHPRCDCRHIPSSEDRAGDLRTDPEAAIRAGQVRGLSRADLQAIRDGADAGQVINASRGMYVADVYGKTVKATTEGTTKRGLGAARMQSDFVKVPGQRYRRAQGPRLRPESIYRVADDRAEALRLLKRFGYLI
jgi:hypothetical protein